MIGSLLETAAAALIAIGASFALIGSWGLVRLPTLMERLHAPTKATTLGLGGMLLGSMLFLPVGAGEGSVHELLISLFLFITAPVTANMIAKVHLLRLRHAPEPRDISRAGLPPPPSTNGDWATYSPPDPEGPAAPAERS